MVYAVRKDTLAGIKQSALFLARSMADQPIKTAVEKLVAYEATGPGMAYSEQEAFKFYYVNHVFSMIAAKYGPHEPLPEPMAELARAYVKLASDLTVRLAYYCLLIITREARNMHPKAVVYEKIKNKWGEPVSNFLKLIHSMNETAAVNKLRQFPPNTTLGQYVSGLTDTFNTSGVWSGGYGGPKWGKVGETLRSLIYGETTPEMFSDTAFTLAHNNGPIFNKDMLYHHVDAGKIFKVLDVQHTGQIPQLWNDAPALRPTGAEMSGFVTKAKALFPAGTGGYVDWYKVAAGPAAKADGRTYGKEKAEQIAKHGPSLVSTALEKEEAARFYVMPGVWVKVYEREKAA